MEALNGRDRNGEHRNGDRSYARTNRSPIGRDRAQNQGRSARQRSRSPIRNDHRSDNRRARSPLKGPSNKDRTDHRSEAGLDRGPGNTRNVRLPSPTRERTARADEPSKIHKPGSVSTTKDSEESLAEIQRIMGFSGFRSTKNTKVPGNDKNWAVRINKKTEYRQYMNRSGGFNRPLSPGK